MPDKTNETAFCPRCHKETQYTTRKKMMSYIINNKTYAFEITAAVCDECGNEVSYPGLTDLNAREIDEQYRHKNGIATVDEIRRFVKECCDWTDILKDISVQWGFQDENALEEYLEGEIPTPEDSGIIKEAISSGDIKPVQGIRQNADSAAFENSTSSDSKSNEQKLSVYYEYPEYDVNAKNGNNVKLEAHILPEEEMRKAGFTDYRKGYWYFSKWVNRNQEIMFTLTISKEDPKDFEIDILDDDFGQAYDYQEMLSSTARPPELAISVFNKVESIMEDLQDLGVISGHVYGEYI